MGCDCNGFFYNILCERFQSTHPGWGATRAVKPPALFIRFQSTHPGWGATVKNTVNLHINTLFQSTHPGWGATSNTLAHLRATWISIHAPRVGCDFVFIKLPNLVFYFNPRTPGGVRRLTKSLRVGKKRISIHAPRVGCDLISAAFPLFHIDFNPRTPGGVRHYYPDINAPLVRHFNPRTPGGVRLYIVQIGKTRHKNFNPRTPGGVRLQGHRGCQKERYFNPRTPGGVRLDCLCRDADCSRISIHAPRVGCDFMHSATYTQLQKFQSTHPGWGATYIT